MLILYVLCIILAILTVLFLICALRAVKIKKNYPESKAFDENTDALNSKQHAEHLSKMIQVPTVSLLGVKDNTQIYKMHKLLEELYPLIHKNLEKKDIDGALLFHWKGKNSKAKPVLLMSHMDVVDATGKWKHPPFDGIIDNGLIYGRGSVDTKCSLCAILEAVEALLSEGFKPECDIYIASSNNEEITGDGAVKTVDYLDGLGVRLALVMDEGGAVMSSGANMMDTGCAMVGVFEKGRANIRFFADSLGGHASVPFKNSPYSRLARLVYRLEYKSPFKKKLTKPVRHMFKEMSPYMAFKYRFLFGNMWLFSPVLPKIMGKLGGKPNALVSTTCVFTMSEGSRSANIIPSTADVTANFRFMIHEGLPDSFKKISSIASKLNLRVEMITGYDCSAVANTKCSAYTQVKGSISKTFGDIPIIPYVMLAGTDSRHYCKICDCVLRFAPVTLTNEQFASAHAVNENISTSSLARAVLFYHDFIKDYKPEN